MAAHEFTAVKLETDDLRACEAFFGQVFGFRIVHHYGDADAPFEEIVMTIEGGPGMLLKFIRSATVHAAPPAPRCRSCCRTRRRRSTRRWRRAPR